MADHDHDHHQPSSPYKVCRGVLMIRPTAFAFNEATAVTNAFQTAPSCKESDPSSYSIMEEATKEFDQMVQSLREANILVVVVDGNGHPDEVFPNNWLVFLDRPRYAIFPMCATTRRQERDKLAEVLSAVNIATSSSSSSSSFSSSFSSCAADEEQSMYNLTQGIDFASSNEMKNLFMEGTGSIVFDHKNKKAYACVSPRTDESLVKEVCAAIHYEPIVFTSRDQNGMLVYHTNVLMSIGFDLVIICAESIVDEAERSMVLGSLSQSGKIIVELSFSQMSEFAGNMLMLPVLSSSSSFEIESTTCVCSSRAYQSLSEDQIALIETCATIVHSPLTTIETYGGGSARCMMAEFY
jgi:hypothetical protein